MNVQQAIETPARPRNGLPQPAARVRRQDVRVTIRVAMRPLGMGGHEVFGWVQNMSPGGMFVRCAEILPPDTYCDIRLIWRDEQVFQAAFIKGWTVYGAEGGMGIQFDPNDQEAAETFVRLARRHAMAAA
jgi:hypothetical protein